MNGKKTTRCEYGACYLPENNKKYAIQFIYLLFSTLYLIMDKTEFTFFSLILFTIPIVLDLIDSSFPVPLYQVVNKIFLGMNVLIILFCFLGMFGMFVDTGDAFCVSQKSLLLPGAELEKKFFLVPLIVNLLIPVMMYNACPSKKTKWVIAQKRKQGKVG